MPRGLFTVIALITGLSACSSGPAAPDVPVRAAGPRTTYVAIGASDSLGVGTGDPLRQAWTQAFFDTALPPGATFVNLAVSGATTADAIRRELPYVAGLRPTVVTVFLGVNDLRAGVSPTAFGSTLRDLLAGLDGAGRPTVLIGNIPPLDRLPAYLACRPNPPPAGPPCSSTGAFPPPEALDAIIAAYNAQVASSANAAGAVVVDLHAAGLAARADGTEASTVSADGFHPNAEGHRLIADAFAAAYRLATKRTP